MKIGMSKERLLASTLMAGAAVFGFAAPAFAQQTTPAPAAEEAEEETITITGSRIARQDFTAISPVTSVGAQDIELTATLSVEQLLNELPQVIPGNTVTSNNAGGEDFATIDLRGLGANRTLVLINGERVAGSSTTGTVDLNTIPAGLIERIDVVTGGASAVYGSDAISGVVNFILKRDYEGAELRWTVGAAQDGNAQETNVDFLLGGNFGNGRGNLSVYGSWYNREGITQAAYARSAVSAAVICDPADPNCDRLIVVDSTQEWINAIAAGSLGTVVSGGSATAPWGSFTGGAGGAFSGLSTNPATAARFTGVDSDCNPATPGVAVNGGTLSFNQQNQLVPFRSAGACAIPSRTGNPGESSRFSFAPDNFLIIPAERLGFTVTGNYRITDTVDAEALVSFANSQATVQLAPTPITGLVLPVNSPLIPADLAAALATRANPTATFLGNWRSSALGGRVGEFQNQAFNSRFTFKGELPAGWEWNASVGYGEANFDGVLRNNVNRTALLQGLAGCANIPSTARLPGCVDVSIYGPNTLTPAMANFIRVNVKESGVYTQSSVAGFVRGDLFDLPYGAVSAVFGAEYRDDEASFEVDDQQRTGNIFGFNATQSINGNVDVYEFYGEVAVPILADLPFANYVGLELGYRTSDYSTVGNVNSYKVGGEYSPFSWLTFRSIFNSAVRAPNVLELFQNGDQGFPGYNDPCNDPPGAATLSSAAQTFCISQGLPASALPTFAQSNSQVQAFAFGNRNLRAEEAETFTYGVVFTPDFLPVGDLDVSVDYYEIEIVDAIVPRGAQTIINSCYGQGVATNPDCARIVRDPTTGQITSVNTTLGNLATFETAGIDVQVEYGFDLNEVFGSAPGSVNIDWLATWTDSYKFNGVDFIGTTDAGIGGALYDFRSVTTVQYTIGDFLFQARHIYTPALESANWGPPNEAPEAQYLDLSGRWDLNDRLRLTLNVDNVFDEEAPQTVDGAPFGQGNTDAQLYRALGRTFSFSGRLKF